MTTRKVCTNVPTATYSGKEQSPLHFGLSAEGYDVNTVMDGYDKLKWIVKIKNNRKVWVRQVPAVAVNKLLHEEPVITNDIVKGNIIIEVPKAPVKDIESVKEEIEVIDASDTSETSEDSKMVPVVTPVTKDDVKTDAEMQGIVKPVVQEKKLTDYNIFLTYRLAELKKNNDKSNKEYLAAAVAEWKDLKMKPKELEEIMVLARAYEKPVAKSKSKKVSS